MNNRITTGPASKLKYLKRVVVYLLNKRKFNGTFTEPPILICGCARSGTTLLLSILDAHPRIHAIDFESNTFAYKRKRSPAVSHLLSMSTIFNILSKQTIKPGADRWCEKTPRNILYLPEILAEFKENVRIIHIIRDGRDVVTSIHQNDPGSFWVPPERWVEEVSLGLKYKDHPQFFTMKYEDIISNFKETITGLLDFLGLEFNDGLLEFDKTTGVKEHHAWKDGLKPIHSSSVQRWKEPRFKERIDHFHEIEKSHALLKKLGYEREKEVS